MALRRVICREHGGAFTYLATPGRQPVRCGGKRPVCDKAEPANEETPSTRAAIAVGVVRSEPVAKPRTAENPSLTLAMAAKKQLEAVGWTVKGRAWIGQLLDGTDAQMAALTASRDAETLLMEWCNGAVTQQDYSMEYTKPSDNNYPSSNLGFDPAELTDRELVQRISGMKVTWWNTLAGATQSAIVPGERVKIEHIFVGNGDEDNSKRVVTFVDRDAGGFRSFHVGALLRVG